MLISVEQLKSYESENVFTSRAKMQVVTLNPFGSRDELYENLFLMNTMVRMNNQEQLKKLMQECGLKQFLHHETNLHVSKCAVCSKKSKSQCGGCKMRRYCSRECQKADWKTHKKVCKSLKRERENQKDQPLLHRVLTMPKELQTSKVRGSMVMREYFATKTSWKMFMEDIVFRGRGMVYYEYMWAKKKTDCWKIDKGGTYISIPFSFLPQLDTHTHTHTHTTQRSIVLAMRNGRKSKMHA